VCGGGKFRRRLIELLKRWREQGVAMTREQIEQWMEERYPGTTLMIADGLEAAFIGVVHRFPNAEPLAAFDLEKCVQIFMEGGMTRKEAEEHMDHNVLGALVGDLAPVFVEFSEEE
jgi:hypothetical protein